MKGNFVRVPWSVEDSELDPYQFRLWVHVARVGICWQSVRTMAKKCGMSKSQVARVRDWMLEHEYLDYEVDPESGKVGLVAGCPSQGQTQQSVPTRDKVSLTGTDRPSQGHQRPSQGHHLKKKTEEEHLKKNPEEERRAHAQPNGFWDLPDNLGSAEFVRAWGRWLSYVDERRLKFTETQAELTLAELSEAGGGRATESVITSIRRGWNNIHLVDAGAPSNGHGKKSATYQADEITPEMEEQWQREYEELVKEK